MRLHVHEWGNAARSDGGVRPRRLGTRPALRGDWQRSGLRLDSTSLAPDLRGHGRSGWEPPWDLDTHLDDVLETFGDTGPSLWVGHSFGGRLVLELAARRPELVRCAVLLDPAIDILPHVGFDFAQDAATDTRLRVRGRGDRRAPDERLPDPALGARGRGARAPRVDPRREAPLALRASRGCDHVQRALPGAAASDGAGRHPDVAGPRRALRPRARGAAATSTRRRSATASSSSESRAATSSTGTPSTRPPTRSRSS